MSNGTNTLVFVDLETGGANASRHPIIQVAALAVNARLEELEAFEVKVHFSEKAATKGSLRKANYSRARWNRDAIEPMMAAREFANFLRRHATVPVTRQDRSVARVAQLAAHNAAFDGPFLQLWYEKLRVYCPARFQLLCTLQRAEWYFAENPELPRPDNFRLLTLCRYFRVPLHPMEAHDALADVRATVGLYRALRQCAATGASTPQVLSQLRRTA